MMAMLVALAMAAAQGATPVHPPAVEKHLAGLIGDWTRAGNEANYRDHCVWYDRRAYVVCSLTDGRNGGRVEAIVGYSAEEGRYTYQSYANNGTGHMSYGYPLGDDGLVFTEERKVEGRVARLTTSMTPQADGRLRLVQDRSVAGQPWERVGEVFYIPRK